jgi:hypothetical protein
MQLLTLRGFEVSRLRTGLKPLREACGRARMILFVKRGLEDALTDTVQLRGTDLTYSMMSCQLYMYRIRGSNRITEEASSGLCN